ncbi:hypothetical protein HYQ46_011845 [Verticillium longisporum]|nr:hypothetical protein HYQ46_011845 [Verticillium longisporum]
MGGAWKDATDRAGGRGDARERGEEGFEDREIEGSEPPHSSTCTITGRSSEEQLTLHAFITGARLFKPIPRPSNSLRMPAEYHLCKSLDDGNLQFQAVLWHA